MDENAFLPVYLDTLKNKVSELTNWSLINETKIAILTTENENLRQIIEDLQSQVDGLKTKPKKETLKKSDSDF